MTWVPENPKYKTCNKELKYVCTAWTWWGGDTDHKEFPASTGKQDMIDWIMNHLDNLWHVSIRKVKI